MASGYTPAGVAYYQCEKCGDVKADFPNKDGKQDKGLAAMALRVHMLLVHNNGD